MRDTRDTAACEEEWAAEGDVGAGAGGDADGGVGGAAQAIRAVEASLHSVQRDIDVWAAELDAWDVVGAVEGGVDDSGCGAGGRESEAGEAGGGREKDGKGEDGAAANAGGGMAGWEEGEACRETRLMSNAEVLYTPTNWEEAQSGAASTLSEILLARLARLTTRAA